MAECDYARKVVLHARSSEDTPVRDIMTADVMDVRPEQTSEECMALMTENRLRHLPVIDGGHPIGLLPVGDVVMDIISEENFIIEQLEHYTIGDRG